MNDYYEINKLNLNNTSSENNTSRENINLVNNTSHENNTSRENINLVNNTSRENKYYEDDDDEEYNSTKKKSSSYLSLWSITHLILLFFAVYLSWRCNNSQLNILHLIFAFCCPHLYIIWALATRGGCGIFNRPQ